MFRFYHERLDCYQLSLEVLTWLKMQKYPRGRANLREQSIRAAESIALNIAEGSVMTQGMRTKHFQIALGSAAETCAALDIVDFPGSKEQQEKLRRIGGMLYKLIKQKSS